MKLSIESALQFLGMLQSAYTAGAPVVASVVAAVKGALAAHGVAADTAQIDKDIAEAQTAKAKEDALQDPPVSPV